MRIRRAAHTDNAHRAAAETKRTDDATEPIQSAAQRANPTCGLRHWCACACARACVCHRGGLRIRARLLQGCGACPSLLSLLADLVHKLPIPVANTSHCAATCCTALRCSTWRCVATRGQRTALQPDGACNGSSRHPGAKPKGQHGASSAEASIAQGKARVGALVPCVVDGQVAPVVREDGGNVAATTTTRCNQSRMLQRSAAQRVAAQCTETFCNTSQHSAICCKRCATGSNAVQHASPTRSMQT